MRRRCETNGLINTTEKIFGILANRIFRICGTLVNEKKADKVLYAIFDFPIEDFAYPYAKLCRIEARSEGNVLYHFLNNYKFPTIPTIEWLDSFLKEREDIMSKWTDDKWHYKDPNTYLKIFQQWMFLAIIRRTFDFNVLLKEKDIKALVKLFHSYPEEFRFWECITILISKVWFFDLICELKERSKTYISAIDALVDEKKLDVHPDSLINEVFIKVEKTDKNLGFPVYASNGEVVFIREFKQNEISKGFIDRKQEWFEILGNILDGYVLRYQWPFGTKISDYLLEICMSFKSDKFKGNGLPDYFISS